MPAFAQGTTHVLLSGLSAHQHDIHICIFERISCGTMSQKTQTIQIKLQNPALIQLTSLNVQNFVKINYYYAINNVKMFFILVVDTREKNTNYVMEE